MVAEILDLETWFFSTDIYGYFGPLALIVIGFLITERNKNLGIIVFIIQALVMYNYAIQLTVTPSYMWQLLIMIIGGFAGCLLPQLE